MSVRAALFGAFLLATLLLAPLSGRAADAAPATGNDVSWAYDKGFKASSADGPFTLAVGGWAHVMWTGLYQDELTTNEFNLRRARLLVRASMFKDLEVSVLLELVKAPPFLDYRLTWQPLPQIGVRVGQFKTPLSRQFLVSPLFRALPTDALPTTKFNLNRDVGAALLGSFWGKKLAYQVGVYNGTKMANAQDNTDLMLAARVETHPFGPVPEVEGDFAWSPRPLLMVGASAAWNPYEKTVKDANGDDTLVHTKQLTVGGDLTLMWKGFDLIGEFFFRQETPDGGSAIKSFGWYGQAGYFVLPKLLQVVGRGSQWRPNTATGDADDWQAVGGLNWFLHGYNAMLQVEYAYLFDKDAAKGDTTSHQARVQVLFKF